MKIGIDITATQDQFRNRGIGKVAKELTQGLLKINKDHEIILFGFEQRIPDFKGKFKFVPFHSSILKSKPYNPIYWKTSFLGKVLRENLDVYISYNFERGLPIGKTGSVIFVHDLIPFITGKYSQTSFIHNIIKKRFYKYAIEQAKQADLVLTNSKYTKSQLIEHGNFDRKKLVVTYVGIDDRFRHEYTASDIQKALNRYGIKFPYILYYGGFERNKNILNLLKAWDIFLSKNPSSETKLVISGKKKAFFRMMGYEGVALENFTNIVAKDALYLPGHVNDKHLPMILKGSSLFVHISKSEGFGIALAEALVMKKPIVASDIPVYREIVKDHSLLVDLNSPEKVADFINKQLIDRKTTSLSVAISWKKVAERALRAIEKQFS